MQCTSILWYRLTLRVVVFFVEQDTALYVLCFRPEMCDCLLIVSVLGAEQLIGAFCLVSPQLHTKNTLRSPSSVIQINQSNLGNPNEFNVIKTFTEPHNDWFKMKENIYHYLYKM